MKITQLTLILPFLAIAACSNDDVPTSTTVNPDASSEQQNTAKPDARKVSEDHVFKTQLDALGTAKLVGKAAQESIDRNQQTLEQARD